jgi:multidrug efflux pump subunit AcrA (membrane-fusion protein)
MSRIVEDKLLEPGSQPKLLDDPQHPRVPPPPPHVPTRTRVMWIALLLLALIVVMFFVGYLPRLKRERGINRQAQEEENSLPEVNVARVRKSAPTSELLLPGNISALNEAYIFARASGYLRKRYVDIGDRVRENQIMAEIEEPDLDQQVLQARGTLAQTQGALGQTQAALEQSQAQLRLQDVTFKRIKTLVGRGVLAQQQGDQSQADYENAAAVVKVSESNVRAAQANVRAAEANLSRLIELQAYEKIRAPFNGVVTARSVDVGSLIAANGAGQGSPNLGVTNAPAGGSSELFRVAQVNVLRMLVNVPQGYAPQIHLGTVADVILQGSQRHYTGKVTRTSQSIDQTTRTMLTEVQIVNKDGSLLPGMYANVKFRAERLDPPLLIPGDCLVTRVKGPMVAVLVDGNKVHYESVIVGRDYGTDIEIMGGLKEGDRVIINPSDDVREGSEVRPASSAKQTGAASGSANKPGAGSGQPGGQSDRGNSGTGPEAPPKSSLPQAGGKSGTGK